MKFNSAYIAGPFFTPEQINIVEGVKQVLDTLGWSYYSPKDDNLFVEGQGMSPKEVLNTNCDSIAQNNIVIAITDGKDVGTMWECGYAFAHGKTILYVWLSRKEGQKFNLMLAASGEVVHSYEDLATYLTTGVAPTYEGPIE
jgi:nucleoside deoxyribosyltransferase